MKSLLRTLHGEAVSPPPIWLMRQAGRYLPEYKETRAKAGSFLDLCYTPELAEEVTLQPLRRYGFDAAILFADILLIPQAMGLELTFVTGEGPRLSWPKAEIDLGDLKPFDELDAVLSPVYETVKRLSASIPAETTLIGFAGAPWTVATYMIAGQGTPDQGPARRFMYTRPDEFQTLIDRITDATIHYLSQQIEVGAEVVKLFDSWAGALAPVQFRKYSIEPAARIAKTLKERYPTVPLIGFPRGAGAMYPTFAAETGADAVALDAQVPLEWARAEMGGIPLQGNMDPMLMVVGGEALKDEAKRIVDAMEGYPFIFNLGHGITPDANPAHVDQLIEAIRG
ncbi:uroporphyrinogen decarboxylase [Rhodobacteraceae bacterium NNCM2]|nr:uroporphyrinogen decarboxylase [Coraliihabitans acroporae]